MVGGLCVKDASQDVRGRANRSDERKKGIEQVDGQANSVVHRYCNRAAGIEYCALMYKS